MVPSAVYGNTLDQFRIQSDFSQLCSLSSATSDCSGSCTPAMDSRQHSSIEIAHQEANPCKITNEDPPWPSLMSKASDNSSSEGRFIAGSLYTLFAPGTTNDDSSYARSHSVALKNVEDGKAFKNKIF